MTYTSPRAEHKIRLWAWVALAISAVSAGIDVWVALDPTAVDGVYAAIWGRFGELGILMDILGHVAVVLFDVVAAIAMKGWRNRVIALAALTLVLASFVVLRLLL